MARVVQLVTTAAVLALALAGCGSDRAETADTGAPPASPPGDQRQIRELVEAQAEAFSDGDWDTLAELTCAKFRDRAADPAGHLVPPISTFGSREETSSLTVPQMSELLAEQFGSVVSAETLDRAARALVDYDEPAYRDAMLDLMTESTSVSIDSVDNIQVDGDTATADVTVTRTMGDGAPETSSESTPFVREGGRWLDCTDMSAPRS
ncbi:hypothetical protein [Mycobacterium sp. NAZ190054]|uniref:Rv0361 family membrane protein n=1 Tax=Mycobacterium sp. NAZ190054 TaxID=1747766 RepID=UPI000792EB31|nr:hypothetical protein [Mycobacterium sp. NAZ190054]KWX57612.1 hypothetical protein ASJ79_11060 [Mycobacterium sp. NAZ190054]